MCIHNIEVIQENNLVLRNASLLSKVYDDCSLLINVEEQTKISK